MSAPHFMVDMCDGTDIRDATPAERERVIAWWRRAIGEPGEWWSDSVERVARELLDRAEAHEPSRDGYTAARMFLDDAASALAGLDFCDDGREGFLVHARAYAAVQHAVEEASGPRWFGAVVALHLWEQFFRNTWTWDDPAIVEALTRLAAASAESLGWPAFAD